MRLSGILAAIVVGAFFQSANADIFWLRSGGRIEGELANGDQNPRISYVITLPGGGQITLDAAVVEKVQAIRPELVEYEKMRRNALDTVQGQLALAEWCREHNLTVQRKTHLERVLVLAPDQPDARRLLGYRKVKDKWMTHDEEMTDKGYVQRAVNGQTRWVTPQEAENRDNDQRKIKAEADWRKYINRYRALLDGKHPEQGKKGLEAIHDSMAIAPLGEHLKKDPHYDARMIYVEVLSRFNTHEARGPLARCAIDDSVEEVRLSCLDELEKQKDDLVAKYFADRMSDKHADDETIDRAGVALGRIKDPTSVATLVRFVAYERTIVMPPAGGPGAMSAAFNRNGGGGGGLAMNQQPKTVRKLVESRGVLDALVAITGQNFGYDPRAWQTWYKNQIAKGAPIAKQ
jgi:hypothetical protein